MRAPRPSSAWRAFYLGLALCLVVAGLALLLWSAPTPHEGVRLAQSQQSGPQPAPQPAPPPLTSAPIRPASAPVPQPEPELADPNDLAAHMPPGLRPEQAPTMGEVIAGLHRAGVRTGLGAFNPPGTRPPLIGLAVPEDFELPAGYVRHHQATDDGQRIEAILMFAPDHVFYDAAGRPLTLPENRVVPPEWAPPGLPIRRVVLPPPRPAEAPAS